MLTFETCLSKEREARLFFLKTEEPGETNHNNIIPIASTLLSCQVAFGRALRRALGHASDWLLDPRQILKKYKKCDQTLVQS